MKGGKLIAQGKHGCVYKPALACKNKNRPDGKVSKLTKKEEARAELREHKRIDAIDLKFRYHLPAPSICVPAKPDKKRDNELKDCTAVDIACLPDLQKKTRILQYEYGGVSLAHFINNTVRLNVPKLLRSLAPLMRALVEFQENKIGHFDIKTDNILIDPKTYKCRFIDFGSTTDYSAFWPKDMEYWIYPNEIIFLNPYPLNITTHLSKINRNPTVYYGTLWELEETVSSNAYTGQHQVFYRNFMKAPKRFANVLADDNLVQFYLHDYERRGAKQIDRAIIRGLDTYAMGLVLVEVWNLVTRDKFDFFADMPTYGTGQTTCSYLDDLFFCIKSMIQPCYQLRASPQTAHKWYKLMLAKMSKPQRKTVKRKKSRQNKTKKK